MMRASQHKISESKRGIHAPHTRINYMGPSMHPTFKSGDQLLVIPYGEKKIRRGDVIAFLPPGGGQRVIHRVVQVDSRGIKTRGDRNSRFDPWLLDPAHIQGRVAYARRGGMVWKVAGGPVGRLSAGVVRAIRSPSPGISAFLRPAYHWLARTGILRQLLNPVIATRIVSFNRQGGREFQLLLGRHAIGWLRPAAKKWHIRPPFRLLVDEPSLPRSL